MFTAAWTNPLDTTQLDYSNRDTPLFPLKHLHPHLLQIIYNQSHIVQLICILPFPQRNYTSHKSKLRFPFQMQNRHQKLPIYQILLIFRVELPPRIVNLTPVLVLLLFKLLPLILSIVINHSIIHPLEVWVYIFHHLFLWDICLYLSNKTQTIKYIQINTSFKIPSTSLKWTPLIVNNSPCPLLGRSDIVSSTSWPTSYF